MNNPLDRSEQTCKRHGMATCSACPELFSADGLNMKLRTLLDSAVYESELEQVIIDLESLIAQRDRQHKERLLAAVGLPEFAGDSDDENSLGFKQGVNHARTRLIEAITAEFGGEEEERLTD